MNMREDELLAKMPHRLAARLTRRRYYDDPEVKGRAPVGGQNWIPSLGSERADGPLTPPSPLELPAKGQAVQPEHDHAADGKGDIADAASTAMDGATWDVDNQLQPPSQHTLSRLADAPRMYLERRDLSAQRSWDTRKLDHLVEVVVKGEDVGYV